MYKSAFRSSDHSLNGGTDVYANPNAPSDKSCNVFDPAGGGITFPTVKASTDEAAYDGGYFIDSR